MMNDRATVESSARAGSPSKQEGKSVFDGRSGSVKMKFRSLKIKVTNFKRAFRCLKNVVKTRAKNGLRLHVFAENFRLNSIFP